MTKLRLAAAMALPILLAACGGQADDDGRSASGEVLEGTISDAMLPIDTVTSQPPLAAPERTGSGGPPSASDAPSDAASDRAEDGEADAPNAETPAEPED